MSTTNSGDAITQGMLTELLELRSQLRRYAELRERIVQGMLRGLTIEPGPWAAQTEMKSRQIISFRALVEMLGEDEASWIRDSVQPTFQKWLHVIPRSSA